MYRTLVILRHTFKEAVVQPIYSLLVVLGVMLMLVFWKLPFFTLTDDTVMFKEVGLDFIMLLVLVVTLFATSRSIFDEIEDRTMLTLMSKPLSRWEVLLGKYLGIVSAALLAVAILGIVQIAVMWDRVPGDYFLQSDSLDDRILTQISSYRMMHAAGLLPQLVLLWMQIAVLAAIGVALSTRLPLVVNLPVVIFIYMAGNLARFLPLDAHSSPVLRGVSQVIATVFPFLEVFDLKQKAIYGHLKVGMFTLETSATEVSTLWIYVAIAAGYAIVYSLFSLLVGLWMFRNRELGGAEG